MWKRICWGFNKRRIYMSQWIALKKEDLKEVDGIGNSIHLEFPECFEVLEEKFYLFPGGCFKLVKDDRIVGYVISHPWILDIVPQLNSFLGKLPARPNCYFIHDIVLLPEVRGTKAIFDLIDLLKGITESMKLSHLVGVSVCRSSILWKRLGFTERPNKDLESYGKFAKYMIAY